MPACRCCRSWLAAAGMYVAAVLDVLPLLACCCGAVDVALLLLAAAAAVAATAVAAAAVAGAPSAARRLLMSLLLSLLLPLSPLPAQCHRRAGAQVHGWVHAHACTHRRARAHWCVCVV